MSENSNVLCFYINEWEDLVHCIRAFPAGYFRGQENSEWGLATTLERKHSIYDSEMNAFIDSHNLTPKEKEYWHGAMTKLLEYKNEFSAIQTFRRLHSIPESIASSVEVLAQMQHYGASTRLLDVTASFLVALFFAFENYGSQDRSVWFFRKHFFLWHSEFMKENMTDEELESAHIRRPIGRLIDDEENFFNKSLAFANRHFYNQRTSADEPLSIIPLNITGNNPRLVAQNGAFMFPTSLRPFNEHLCSVFKITEDELQKQCSTFSKEKIRNVEITRKIAIIKFVISIKLRSEVECLLQAANISARSIYPDEIGIAKSIQYW